jgi:hypothetical protein
MWQCRNKQGRLTATTSTPGIRDASEITRVVDPGCLYTVSRIQICPSRIQGQKDPGYPSKNLRIFIPKKGHL